MDKAIDARFERVEKALTALIDSIAKYNPSINIANDLALADRELSKGLAELQVHQNNHIRIQCMRADIAATDARIKATISSLATTRRDITATPVTPVPDRPGNEVQYHELLNYARRISKTTLPPSGVTNGVDMDAPPPPAAISSVSHTPADTTTAAHTPSASASAGGGVATPTLNGANTPGASSQNPPPPEMYAAAASLPAPATTAAPTLPDHMAGYLNPNAGAVFVPWPSETQVRMGSLATTQDLLDKGVDIRDYDPAEETRRKEAERAAEEQRKEAERLAREEEARRMREEHERRRKAAEEAREREIDTWRRDSMAEGGGGGGGAGAPKPGGAGGEKKQFQFFGDMDDDDED